jgi:hypothetical protein
MRCAQTTGIVVGLVILLGAASNANAARGKIGTDVTIRQIQPTNHPQYILCYKISTVYFIAGCYVTDDGYVLQKGGESNEYYPLDPATIQKLQHEGVLPTPLPKYALSIFDYAIGYSNWIILAFAGAVPFFKWATAKMRKGPKSVQVSRPTTA